MAVLFWLTESGMQAFTDSSYWSAQFADMDISKQQLSEIEFDGCCFTRCNFSGAVLSRCNFVDCEFEHCDLNLVDLGYSKFADVVFSHCKLRGVDWARVSWPRVLFSAPLQFQQCLLDDASFYGVQLPELIMENCRARHADFRDADLSKASFCRSDLGGAQFANTVLEEADFCEAQDYHIDIFHNRIKGAKFSRYDALSLLDSLEIELHD